MPAPSTIIPVHELTDAKLWRERYAWGIPLGGSADLSAAVAKAKGSVEVFDRLINAIPDRVIEYHLAAAASELELKIGQPLRITRCRSAPVDDGLVLGRDYDVEVARLPYLAQDTAAWFRIDLPGGVVRVSRIRAIVWEQVLWTWTDADESDTGKIIVEWGRQGIVHILPKMSMMAMFAAVPGSFWNILTRGPTPYPGFWAVDYDLAPRAKNGTIGTIERVYADWVACTAGQMIFGLAGVAKAQGVSNVSVSIDGVSESIGTTATQTYGLFSALQTVFKERAAQININSLIQSKRGIRIRALVK